MSGLTFGEEETTVTVPVTAAETLEKEGLVNLDGSPFTDEEKKEIKDFVKQIDLKNTQGIIQYGNGVQKKMADFSDTVLSNVRAKDLGEVGKLLTATMMDLKGFDLDDQQKGGFAGFVKRHTRKMGELKASYDKAAVNVDKVVATLQSHQDKLMGDIDMLEKMYDSNLEYYKLITMYIAAGKMKLEQVRNNDLPAAVAKAKATGKAEDAQAAKDIEDQLTRFEKKLYDLQLTRAIALQTAPQIRMIQNNDQVMVEKIQSTVVNTIPLWKNQMVLALGLNDSLIAAKAESDVDDMTNALLKSNASKLKIATIETAKASERGIVDIATLKQTNQTLISTLDEVAKIHSDGRAQRAQAEVELQKMEDAMKAKLLEMSSGSLNGNHAA